MTTNKMFKSFIKPLNKGIGGEGEKTSGSHSYVNSICSTLALGVEAKGLKSPGGILIEMWKERHHMQILEKLLAVKKKEWSKLKTEKNRRVFQGFDWKVVTLN